MTRTASRKSTTAVALAATLLASASHGGGQVIGWGSDQFAELPPTPATVLPFTKVSAGTAHSAALRADGAILCFGMQSDGRCDVPANLGPCKAVAAGGSHTAAVRVNGVVACWGSNVSQQCNVPASLGACRDVAAGSAHTLALRLDGSVAAWGSNASGQSTVPKEAAACTAIAAGGSHSVALLAGGGVVCWGSNANGQATVPAGLPACKAVAAGTSHTVVLRVDGTVQAWGSNANGQCSVPAVGAGCLAISAGGAHSGAVLADGSFLGWGSNAYGQAGAGPVGLGPCVAISAGGGHTMAIRRDGALRCFGAGSVDAGQSPDYGQSIVPSDLGTVASMAGGGYHAVALRDDGGVRCWGSNTSGQSTVPANLGTAIAVAAGSAHSAAIRSSGSVVAWGDNSFGQTAVPVNLGQCNAVSANAAGNHTLARRTNGQVAAWGANSAGQSAVPAGLGAVAGIAAGGFHSMALRPDGTVACWGSNTFGQSTPPAGLADAVRVVSGGYHSVALRDGGAVSCWGRNGNGQCTVPAGLGACVDVAAGVNHTVALRSDGTVACWGANASGQSTSPPNLASVAAIAAGGFSTYAILDTEASGCGSSGAPGAAALEVSGSVWENVGVWKWANAGPRVPGAQTAVDLGAYGSVAAGCDARAGTLELRGGTSLLVRVDASAPAGGDTGSISVSGQARLAGRIWLIGTGGTALPDDLFVPVLDAGQFVGSFDLIQSTLPAPPGKFLTLVPTTALGGSGYALALLPLPGSGGSPTSTQPGGFDGAAVAAEAMDWDGDGDDDLALAIDFGASVPGRLQVLLNVNGNLDGANSVIRATPPQPRCLAVGQLDADGKTDAAVGFASDNTVRTYYNASPATSPPFNAGTPIQLGATPLSIVIDDATALMPAPGSVIVGTSANTLTSYSSSSGSQIATVTLPSVPTAVSKKGTVVATGGGASESLDPVALPGALVRVLQSPNGALSVDQVIPVPGIPVLLDFEDIDGDGLPEVITANASPSAPEAGGALPVLTLFRGQAAGFGGAVPIEPAGASAGLDVVLVDADDDGDRDIVSVHATSGTQSAASVLRIDLDPSQPQPPLTIGADTALPATQPVLAARGNLDGVGGEDVFLVDDAPISQLLGGTSYGASVKPFRGAGGCPSDLSGDGLVDGADLTVLLSFWGYGDNPADLDGNGTVNGADLGILFSGWGPCPGGK